MTSSSLPSEGWHHYLSEPPPSQVLLEWGKFTDRWLWRQIMYVHDVVAEHSTGIYWRWTGIGKEEYAKIERLRMRFTSEDLTRISPAMRKILGV